MPSYEILGKFYDAAMGDRVEAARQVAELIRAAKPNAKSVLELACGTGSILKRLQRSYEVSGLDISSRMLSIARQKVPRAKFVRQDTVDFQIDARFDVIFCVFDSINHVQRFADWRSVFAGARRIQRRVAASSLTSTRNENSNGLSPGRHGCISSERTS
jgi:dTDP-3-amino-3,6-dideoxy-alpha-D-glucopyranose N,N-dimethyltransferase/dTDP-3-amino-3,4,6-trideoxy-alpha-D-glucopyranose N,N-dimethyltransferase